MARDFHENDYGQIKFHFDNIFFENPQLFESIILYQIGDLGCEGGYEIGVHKQRCYEISYIVSGKGVYSSDNREYPVKKGDVYLNLPGEIHNGKADAIDPFRYFCIGFNFADVQNDQDSFSHIKKMFDQIKTPVRQDKYDIQSLFINIFRELINLNNYSNVMLSTYLHQIVILTYRCFFENWDKEYSQHNDNSKQILYEIINRIDTNLCKIKDLSEIADMLGYSYSHLSRLFTNETGLSIQEYYNKKRFDKAVEWLKMSDMSITSIAENLQYQSIHSFSRAFRKNFGICPTEFQELCKKDKQSRDASE